MLCSCPRCRVLRVFQKPGVKDDPLLKKGVDKNNKTCCSFRRRYRKLLCESETRTGGFPIPEFLARRLIEDFEFRFRLDHAFQFKSVTSALWLIEGFRMKLRVTGSLRFLYGGQCCNKRNHTNKEHSKHQAYSITFLELLRFVF